MPFSIRHYVDRRISLCVSSKKSNDVMGKTYSDLFNLPTTGLRFLAVYGPWGWPDREVINSLKLYGLAEKFPFLTTVSTV